MPIKNKLSSKSKKLKFQFISGGTIKKIKSKKLLSKKTKSRKYRLRKSLHFPYSNGDIVYVMQEV